MKKVWILLALVLVIVGGLCLGIYRKDTSYDRIVESISLNEAMKIAEANPACFLVRFSDGATGSQYQIVYGTYAGSDIEILGESTPARDLGGVFKGENLNGFNSRPCVRGDSCCRICKQNF